MNDPKYGDTRPMEEAPRNRMILVFGSGGWTINYVDEFGVVRNRAGRPRQDEARCWMPLPEVP